MRHAESLADELCKDDIDEETYRILISDFKSFEKNLEKIVVKVHGGGMECPVCGAKFPVYMSFGVNPRKNALCPNCGALERHRALYLLIKQLDYYKPNMRILHFAPEKIFYDIFSSLENVEYWPVDLNPEQPFSKKVVDITDIPFEDNYFDLIMCNHVLEHIPDDKKAMSELYRVLKSESGMALLNVPIYSQLAKTFENPEYNTPELRLKYFGQEDHVRKYGPDYIDRLRAVGFFVEEITGNRLCDQNDFKKYGLPVNIKLYLCKK